MLWLINTLNTFSHLCQHGIRAALMSLRSPLRHGLASSVMHAVLSFGRHLSIILYSLTLDWGKALLIAYVDDTTITGDDQRMSWKLSYITNFIRRIWENYDISWALRWHDPKMVLDLSQRKHVLDILKETRLLGTRPVETPKAQVRWGALKSSLVSSFGKLPYDYVCWYHICSYGDVYSSSTFGGHS